MVEMGSSTQLLGAELQISYKKKILRYWLKATTLYTNFVCVYRPPLSRKNKLTDAMFHDEFPDFLDFVTISLANVSFLET